MQTLDTWEARLEDLFDGKPADYLDAALTDTVNKFPVDIQPFRDMIDGMRSDLVKTRYQTYDELYEYCYRVAGTVALMVMPVMGVDPKYKVRTNTAQVHHCDPYLAEYVLCACDICELLVLVSLILIFRATWSLCTVLRWRLEQPTN